MDYLLVSVIVNVFEFLDGNILVDLAVDGFKVFFVVADKLYLIRAVDKGDLVGFFIESLLVIFPYDGVFPCSGELVFD